MSPKAKADDSPGSPTANDHAAPGDKVESVNNAKDNASLKRAREGSQEPTPSPNPTPLATKKNRLETTSEEVPAGSTGLVKEPSSTSESGAGGETGKVGEVRRKVQEMGWEEIKDEEVREAKAQATEAASADQAGQDKEGEAGGLKRKTLQRNESSVLGAGEEVPAKKSRETPSPPPESKEKEDAVPPAAAPAPAPAPAAAPAAETKKPQATFGSFSKTASPFGAGAGAGRTASPFATASSSSASGSKPLSTGSAFGTYSSSFSAFSKKPPVVPQPPADPSSTSSSDPTAKTDAGPSGSGSGSTFGDILSQSKADEGERGDKVQMTEKDVYTGEEDEETVYQCRAKLYVMQADGGWKERGVGALRLNVRASDQKGPRLVMRAEGVLRLILNISLYVGMACLEDGKHVRATVFEDNEKRFITFRLGTQKAASELCQNIQDHIPLESSTKSPRPDAPSPSPAV